MPELIDVRNLYRLADIRDELQIVKKRIAARKLKHQLDAGEGDKTGSLFYLQHLPSACALCNRFDGQLEGIDEAIRTFGGRQAKPRKKAAHDD